jgi:hypothetical protein
VAVTVGRSLQVEEMRVRAEPLRWREIETHDDGAPVTVQGRVGTVTLREVRGNRIWADFELVVEPNGLRIPCAAFPATYLRLRGPLLPGQYRKLLARVSFAGIDGPGLHVLAWS